MRGTRLLRRHLRDTSRLGEGSVSLTFLSAGGSVLDVWDLGKNIIVLQGAANMSHLLAGDDVGNRKIVSVSLGDAGHEIAEPTHAKPVSAGDTALFGSTVISKPVTVDYPNGAEGGQVRFSATIGADEANGSGSQAISEYGLFDVSGRLLAHKTSGLVSKSDMFGILLQWVILYV